MRKENLSSLRRILKRKRHILKPPIHGGCNMKLYYLTAGVLQFAVHFLLICGVTMLLGRPCAYLRAAVASVAGTFYPILMAVFVPDGQQNWIWYAVSLLFTCMVAFGIHRSGAVGSLVFCLLKIGLEGMGNKDSLLWILLLVLGFSIAVFWRKWHSTYVPVEISYGGRTVKLTALLDSGHNLRDPISGKRVLVVDADVAGILTGLSGQQLKNPIENVEKIVGLRLIPYKTVGSNSGFLLAFSVKNTKIGGRRGSAVVAMAPYVLDEEGKFQALIGGTV